MRDAVGLVILVVEDPEFAVFQDFEPVFRPHPQKAVPVQAQAFYVVGTSCPHFARCAGYLPQAVSLGPRPQTVSVAEDAVDPAADAGDDLEPAQLLDGGIDGAVGRADIDGPVFVIQGGDFFGKQFFGDPLPGESLLDIVEQPQLMSGDEQVGLLRHLHQAGEGAARAGETGKGLAAGVKDGQAVDVSRPDRAVRIAEQPVNMAVGIARFRKGAVLEMGIAFPVILGESVYPSVPHISGCVLADCRHVEAGILEGESPEGESSCKQDRYKENTHIIRVFCKINILFEIIIKVFAYWTFLIFFCFNLWAWAGR